MANKDIKKTTPSYTVVVRNPVTNAVIDPTTITKIEVFIYNLNTDTLLIKFTSADPVPAGETALVITSADFTFTIPASVTENAESGQNRVDVWITTGSVVECMSGILNEFIDAKDAV